MRTPKLQIHLKRDDHKTTAAQTPIVHEVPAAPAKQEVAHPNARLALRQHSSDPRKLDVMISNDKRVGGFRFTIGTPQHDAAPVGKASGGAAAKLHYGTATNTKSGAIFGFSDEPDARIPMSDGEVGDFYHVLVSVELPISSPYKSWYAFAKKLCIWNAVLSDGDGNELTVADSCSPLADPLTPAPTPAPTPRADNLDLTLRLHGVASEAFGVAQRHALQAAIAVGTMVQPSAVRLVDARAGGGDGFYYLDVRFALTARSLQDVNKMEMLIVGDEPAFVATVIEQLHATGQPNLVTADDVSLRKLKVSGGFEGSSSGTKAVPAHCASVWMAWSMCTVPCGGGGTQMRKLTTTAAASNADANCPLSQTRSCGENSCAPTAAPTPPPTPPPTLPPPTPPPTPRPTEWFERMPTPAPTPRVTREGEVFTTNNCSHTTCRVLKMKKAEGRTTHVVRVLHANAEQRGVRHRCMYNDVQRECLCKCSSKDEELCPAYNPSCMAQNHGATIDKSSFVRLKGWVHTPGLAPAPVLTKGKSAVASP